MSCWPKRAVKDPSFSVRRASLCLRRRPAGCAEGFLQALLHAFARVRSRSVARLLIFGEVRPARSDSGPWRRILDWRAVTYGDPVYMDDPFTACAAAPVLVLLLGIRRGLPTPLIEAMACGAAAVVGTDCPSRSPPRYKRPTDTVSSSGWAIRARSASADPRRPGARR